MSAETSIQHPNVGRSDKASVLDFPAAVQSVEVPVSSDSADVIEMPAAIQETASEAEITEEDELVYELADAWRQSIASSSIEIPTDDELDHNQINHCLILLRPILACKLHLELDYVQHLFVSLNEPKEVTKLSEVIHTVLTVDFDDKNSDKTSKDKLDCLRDHVSELAAKVLDSRDVHSGVVNIWRHEANRRREIEEGLFDFRKLQGVNPYELTGIPYRDVNQALGAVVVRDAVS